MKPQRSGFAVWFGSLGLAMLTASGVASTAQAQVVQPGQAAQEQDEDAADATRAEQTRAAEGPTSRVPSYAAQPNYETIVRGEIAENDPIGSYDQPRWTASRLFPTTRVYVLPAKTIQLEYWLDTVMPFSTPSDVRFRNLYEVEMGLGYRLQLDLYVRTEQQGDQGPLAVESEKLELRWALADWGVIPGNPTLYFEASRFTDGPATLESKLLLGGNIGGRLHWGANLVFEHDLWGDALANQYGVTGGISYALIDRVFSLGAELQVESTDQGKHVRNKLDELWVLAGPTIQWRPVPPAHVDLVALVGGLGERDTDKLKFKAGMRPLLVVGWEL